MAMWFYPLDKLTEISIWDPRLSASHLVELTKYDYSKGVFNFTHPAVKRTKKQ
jgi:hypothetical protein